MLRKVSILDGNFSGDNDRFEPDLSAVAAHEVRIGQLRPGR
jgi:hypothetical protein